MESIVLDNLIHLTGAALKPLATLLSTARDSVRARVSEQGRVSASLIEAHQTAAHGLAWLATYVNALAQMQEWAEKLQDRGELGEIEALIHQIAFGEYLAQIAGGIPMSQGEMLRPSDLGLTPDMSDPAIETLIARGNSQAARMRLVTLMREQAGAATFGATGLDEELEMIRDQFRRFSVQQVEPLAHDWHLNDELIPMAIIEEMAELGVFGLTIPEEVRRLRTVENLDVRGQRGTQPWLHRCRLAWHSVRDCGGTDPVRRHRRPESRLAAGDCQR